MDLTTSPWHRGERAVQDLLGERAEADAVAGGIGAELPEVARAFLRRQRFVALAAADDAARVWVTVLAGDAGFVQAPTPGRVRFATTVDEDDPLAGLRRAPAPVGLLAIEPASRRRMRVNGRARPGRRPDGGDALVVDVEQALSNCPRFIQQREPSGEPRATVAAAPATAGDALSAGDRGMIRAADTLFIGTVGPDGHADASHRGGSPGFVVVDGPRRLRFGDYAGNSMYMTLGNLHTDPRVGLVFVDWTTGDLLHVSGTAAIDFDADRAAAAFPGARRVLTVDVEAVVRRPGRLPFTWTPPVPSRHNPPAPAGPG